MTEKHYFAHPLVFQFTATVIEAISNEDGTSTIILDETYFYPTGGGQSHDLGTLGGQKIVDVRKEGEIVLHIIEGEALSGAVEGIVDADYRRRNMAAHTGQHILSALALKNLDADTLAVRMNAQGLSTVDVSVGDLSESQIDALENRINEVIRSNVMVKSYFVPVDSPKLEELRRAVKFDKVAGDVRLVEIEGIDLSACAGTHVPVTGMLGMLKIFKVENYKGGSRIHFAAGQEALEQLRHAYRILDSLSTSLSSGIEDVPEIINKLQSERSDLAKQVKNQAEALLSYEAQVIINKTNDSHLILSFSERDNNDLRTLANLLTDGMSNTVIMSNQIGADVTVLVATSDDAVHAGNLLKAILAEFDGRGGGRDSFAQGVLKDFADLDRLQASIENNMP